MTVPSKSQEATAGILIYTNYENPNSETLFTALRVKCDLL